MENNFSNDFKILLNKTILSPGKIAGTIIVTFIITAITEFTFFFLSYTKFDIVACKLPGDNTSEFSFNNCFKNEEKDLSLSNCLNDKYFTNSNYSLSFNIPATGFDGDRYSKLILAFSILCYFSIMGIFEIVHYFHLVKKKRIIEILGSSKILVDGENKYEKRFGIFFIVMVWVYVILKLVWIFYRSKIYSTIDCYGEIYDFKVQQGLYFVTALYVIFQTILTISILPALYIVASQNYLCDVNLKVLLNNLSYGSINELNLITTLDVKIYRKLIQEQLAFKYSNDNIFKKIIRLNTFSFEMTKTDEICEILKNHKENHSEDFKKIIFDSLPKNSINTLN
ncbi:hypothetical protein DICPUDRAFT_75366 [Dictyostelium purpureum]|uniref:Uncharacterized protein n=1 Tax=Dictyostelium purpureum TaxID=5786 RepID=F0ZAH5_DICPU|nr:uncharacterized protein DICPUDRAFT_75366 [Dictyostelium purpureum]EGC39073.1 hypothetical protein DICPUDRAFT_75366 [Dictyostelium purpureum]|eukprot:XP_003284423.1 hypothetical protein DICPUDRAFT_75366 [Dictyostelium purpureum]